MLFSKDLFAKQNKEESRKHHFILTDSVHSFKEVFGITIRQQNILNNLAKKKKKTSKIILFTIKLLFVQLIILTHLSQKKAIFSFFTYYI